MRSKTGREARVARPVLNRADELTGLFLSRLRPRRAGLRFTRCAHLTTAPSSSGLLRVRHSFSFTPIAAEVSGSSFGVGFEAGYLLGATDKRVLLLYRREAEKRISLLITGNAHPRCTVIPYSDLEEVKAFVSSKVVPLNAKANP